MTDIPMDDWSFLSHCATQLANRSFKQTELARLCRMAELPEIAQLWDAMEQSFPNRSVSCDDAMKMTLVVDALNKAKRRLDKMSAVLN